MPRAGITSIFPRACELFGGWTGLAIYRIAEAARRIVALTTDVDSANIAVMCEGFVRYGCEQVIGLRQVGLNVTLYYIDRLNEFAGDEEERAQFLARAEGAGVELVPLPRRRIRSLPAHTFWLHRDLRRRKIATAVVHPHIDPRYATLGLALQVALILHDPQPHSGDEWGILPAPARLVPRFAELTSSCLIVHSDRLLDQIRPLLRRLPIGVVPHGADVSTRPAPVPKNRRLLLFGRLFAYKGVDTALEAFSSLPEDMSDATLIIAGRGPSAVLARGMRNVEVREEYIPDSDLAALLEDARLVLLPYKDATQSGVGLQAIAHGVPCIVSCTGGLPELVPNSLPGLIVPPDDPKRLADAIIAHIDHDETLRRTIYDYTAAHFRWSAVAQRLHSEMRRLGLYQSRAGRKYGQYESADRVNQEPDAGGAPHEGVGLT